MNRNVQYAVHDCDMQGGASGSPVFNFETQTIYALHAQSSSNGSPFPVFEEEPTQLSPLPGNFAIATARFFSALQQAISSQESDPPEPYSGPLEQVGKEKGKIERSNRFSIYKMY